METLSVVITVLNVEQSIAGCLNSLEHMNFARDRYEIVVVDGGSTDGTFNILRKYGDIRVLSDVGGSIGSGRNKGILASKGDIIAVTDGDMAVDSDWLNAILSALQNPEIGCVGGPVLTAKSSNRFAGYVGAMREESPRFTVETFVPHDLIYSRNCAYRRDALKKAGLFNESLVAAEDPELNWRVQSVGYKLMFTPKMKVYHEHRSTLRGLLKQRFRNGVGCGQLLKLNRRTRKTNLRVLLLLAFFLALSSMPLYLATGNPLFLITLEALLIAFSTVCFYRGLETWRDTRRLDHIPVIAALNAVALPAWIAGIAYGLTRRVEHRFPRI